MGSSEHFEDLHHQTDFDCSGQTLCCQLETEQKLNFSKMFYFSF